MLVKQSFDLAIVANSGAVNMLLLKALCSIARSVSTTSRHTFAVGTVKHRLGL